MSGLSQLELDALCSGYEGNADDPSSPIGALMLARKRQRRGQRPPTIVTDDAPAALEEGHLGHVHTESWRAAELRDDDAEGAAARGRSGLTQDALDELSVVAQPAEELVGSPLGMDLRRAKNMRRWGAAPPPRDENAEQDAAAAPAPAPAPGALAARALLPYPSSWGSPCEGLSQAELDTLCDGDNEGKPDAAPEEPPPPSPGPPSPAPASIGGSPAARKRRGQLRVPRENTENLGKVTPLGSPAKSVDMASPGGELMSPQPRFQRQISSPLSPVKLN